jgi:GDP-D-mannose dehydratase
MRLKALITGITGFVGSHLAEFLLDREVEVYGTVRWRSQRDNIEHLDGKVHLIECDLKDAVSMRRALADIQPDHVYHLAAQSFVPTSWKAPAETLDTNIIGQLNLFEACRDVGINPLIQIAGSSEEYGMVYPDEVPIKEENPLRPLSPYAVSKVAQDMLAYQYYQSYGLNVIRTRAFNHSVSRYTPVLLRDDRTGLIDIRYIGELRKYKPSGYKSGTILADGTTVWDMSRHEMSVWADSRWSKLIHLSCHALKDDRVLRIVSGGGIVEVTGNHAVMTQKGKMVVPSNARDLRIGDRLRQVEFPESAQMMIHEDVAWFLGFFVAEGSIRTANLKISVTNKQKPLLDRCQEILLKHFGRDSYFTEDQDSGVYALVMRKPWDFAQWLKPQVYAPDGNKRVPQCILNAQTEAKLAFLRGYNIGDGLQAGCGNYEFKNFKTKSPILALGLCYLVANTTKQRMCLNCEEREDRFYYSINLNSDNPDHVHWGKHLEIPADVIKKIQEVQYEGEVWDFETEDHVFHAGIGRNLVHNTGPRRGDVFVTSNFAKQIARIEKGLQQPVVKVGNLEAQRDFTDVRDIVRGYWLGLTKGAPGEVYNLASGRAVPISAVLDILLSDSTVKIRVEQDPERLRPSDVPILWGDSSKFQRQTGWEPKIPLEQTLRDLLDYWRQKL